MQRFKQKLIFCYFIRESNPKEAEVRGKGNERRRKSKYVGLLLADYCLESCSNYDLISQNFLLWESKNIVPPQEVHPKRWKNTLSLRSPSCWSKFFSCMCECHSHFLESMLQNQQQNLSKGSESHRMRSQYEVLLKFAVWGWLLWQQWAWVHLELVAMVTTIQNSGQRPQQQIRLKRSELA